MRQIIRQKRQSLTRLLNKTLLGWNYEQIKHLSIIDNAKNIAIYLSSDGEIDTQPIIEWLWKQKKRVLLPVLASFFPRASSFS